MTHSVFSVHVCSTVNEMFGALAVSCSHSHVQRRAVQLSTARDVRNVKMFPKQKQNICTKINTIFRKTRIELNTVY